VCVCVCVCVCVNCTGVHLSLHPEIGEQSYNKQNMNFLSAYKGLPLYWYAHWIQDCLALRSSSLPTKR